MGKRKSNGIKCNKYEIQLAADDVIRRFGNFAYPLGCLQIGCQWLKPLVNIGIPMAANGETSDGIGMQLVPLAKLRTHANLAELLGSCLVKGYDLECRKFRMGRAALEPVWVTLCRMSCPRPSLLKSAFRYTTSKVSFCRN